ncbi:hypothetical protein [Polaribacter marinivivus]|uniref:hypothetical protein n=1 Tax=Polaribacter marinivivus TaxID=1524260 RepID=UPI003D33A46E
MGIKCSEEIAELKKMADRKEKDSLIKEKLNYIIPICKESIVEYKVILQKLEAL